MDELVVGLLEHIHYQKSNLARLRRALLRGNFTSFTFSYFYAEHKSMKM